MRRAVARSGLMAKWSTELEPGQDLAWRTVLELFARLGRAPRLKEIASELDMPEEKLAAVLHQLHGRDLIGVDENQSAIVHAYPLAQRDTGHRVELNGVRLNALCAVDALGMGSMYRRDVAIQSACRCCGTEIRITTAQRGTALASRSPAGSVVWYDHAYEQTAAASCCPMIAFFCSDAHLQVWLTRQVPARIGCRLALDEAFEVGRAIFGPVLSPATSPV
ncbi:MAG: hypothetical protein HYR63_03860 [Proteobacteria bacterium]|nr:hypothetical protein [Pseudomonadota bacterium]